MDVELFDLWMYKTFWINVVLKKQTFYFGEIANVIITITVMNFQFNQSFLDGKGIQVHDPRTIQTTPKN